VAVHLLKYNAHSPSSSFSCGVAAKQTTNKKTTTDKMKNSIKTIMAALLVSGFAAGSALAADTATQNVSFTVDALNSISVSGDPAPLGTVSHATDTSTTYSVFTNGTAMRITAQLDTPMPVNVTLNALLAHPTGASTSTAQNLTNVPLEVVSGITALSQTGLGITYNLSALASVVPAAVGSRVVTLTVTQ
jgi:hypothetical protein